MNSRIAVIVLTVAAAPSLFAGVVPQDSVFAEVETLESTQSGQIPNYLLALADMPKAVKPFAHLFRTEVAAGVLEPELKLAMGLKIAQLYSSKYVSAHTTRLLQATDRGRQLLDEMAGKTPLTDADALALKYAGLLNNNVLGVTDADFRATRQQFNDAQVVELTLTVCFFNYFTRMAEGFHLAVEPWASEPAKIAPHDYHRPIAWVSLISDEEMKGIAALVERTRESEKKNGGWGIGIANSMRAMLLSPEIATAWMDYGNAVREYSATTRELKLQISFAVSTANGCRYCTLHQVLGLRRLGVSPAKLMQMQKDDSALTPPELAAVQFARKLTKDPVSVTDADYAGIRKEFGDQGAREVVLQTCAFAFMNRFTDGLRLPSEDEAIKVYRDTYGKDYGR